MEKNQAANDARGVAFPQSGKLGKVEDKVSKTGTKYLVAPFSYTTLAGKAQTRTAMAFGKARESVLASFVSDAEIRLYGRLDGGTFAVIDMGLPPKTEEQKAAEAKKAA